MKIFGLGGMPATGKTTLMRALMAEFEPSKVFRWKTVVGHLDPNTKTYFVGIYQDGEIFAGTDKLSMQAPKDFKLWLKALSRREPSARVLFEGDRLFIQSVLDEAIALKDTQTFFAVLESTDQVRSNRKRQRADSQTERFIKSRKTKVQNLTKKNRFIEVWQSNSDQDHQSNVQTVFRFLKSGAKTILRKS